MSNVTRLSHALPLSPTSAIAKAINAAKAAGLPQGLNVALLHGLITIEGVPHAA